MAKTVLITGAGGFLGGYAAAAFGEAGWRVAGVDRSLNASSVHPAHPTLDRSYWLDVGNGVALSNALGEVGPDVCVHLAGPSSVPRSFESPLEDFEGQVLATFRLLETIRRRVPSLPVLIASSAAVYGDPRDLPVSEAAPPRPISPYGYHKLQQEQVADEFRELFGLAICTVRIFSTYGPGLKHLAVWDITRRALAGSGQLRGTGEESRDYLHARDVASALVLVAERASFAGEVFNIASGQETPIRELARLIYGALGTSLEPEFHEARESGKPVRWRGDVSRLATLGFSPRVALLDGLKDTIRWICKSE